MDMNMDKPNMAILIAGLHCYTNCHKDCCGRNVNMSYKEYVKNIKTKIYGYFEKDYNIDTFIATNQTDELNDVLNTYMPINYDVDDNNKIIKHVTFNKNIPKNYCIKKIKALKLLIDYINESKKRYDIVLLTRFDIYIIKEFTKNNINLNKFNIVSQLEHAYLMDDNLYIFPIKYLYTFFNVFLNCCVNYEKKFNKNKNKFPHCIIPHLLPLPKYFDINYICNDNKNVPNLSFYKLAYFPNTSLIINKTLYTENVIYNSTNNTSNMKINENLIEFNKYVFNKCAFAWIGYELEKTGSYKLSFEMMSNKDIINFDFIKMHNPIKFYKTQNILKNSWTTIDIIIENKEKNSLLVFIFDKFNDCLNIIYKDIKLEFIEH
jgi:hypothetical protein